MKIGILGSGIVGRVLSNAFIAEGNKVMPGTRDALKSRCCTMAFKKPGS